MSDTEIATGGFAVYKPTIFDRLWRWAGFRYHFGEDPPDYENLPGRIRTESGFSFGMTDRLRILMTGRLKVVTALYTDTPSPTVIKTQMDWQIFAPGRFHHD
jgi:hypothetical protein